MARERSQALLTGGKPVPGDGSRGVAGCGGAERESHCMRLAEPSQPRECQQGDNLAQQYGRDLTCHFGREKDHDWL